MSESSRVVVSICLTPRLREDLLVFGCELNSDIVVGIEMQLSLQSVFVIYRHINEKYPRYLLYFLVYNGGAVGSSLAFLAVLTTSRFIVGFKIFTSCRSNFQHFIEYNSNPNQSNSTDELFNHRISCYKYNESSNTTFSHEKFERGC